MPGTKVLKEDWRPVVCIHSTVKSYIGAKAAGRKRN